ncbi:autotransporter outer membrane beta-barrel domain-containing protein [Prosthecobacter vanneervenii]|uniref:Autotransporter domain-containing protein n=1 Tax=Prosthecobacter vanneervenii TaxID=48466 RepID=A0A7W8DHX9_9BACT|nr:autotransporter outer membrane beta-barrel domain-containing protein [Prosthecobacter vanneervenii]MBB5030574.1 hypothetical protein [Prosthecobacter vanneervenii]
MRATYPKSSTVAPSFSHEKPLSRLLTDAVMIFVMLAGMAHPLLAADPPPSSTSTVGQTVSNPETGMSTKVSSLITDPVGTPTAGTTAFVRTEDGYVFLVKAVGDTVYNEDSPPVGFKILSKDTTTKTVTLQNPLDATKTATLGYEILYTDLQANFLGADTAGATTPPTVVSGADGVRVVYTGQNGSNGRDGALFVPPRSGGNGAAGPTVNYTTSFNISTTNKIGLEVGSIGGKGGNGGDSYLSFWDGRDGGNGGAGGTVTAINNTGFQIATTGDNMYGIYAYSRSGQAGNGGSGFAAPGGGTGGHSSDGGNVTVTNNGTIITAGAGAYGIYALSVSNNGGNGGSTWGLVGQAGSGNYGGNGGTVTVTNSSTGSIYTYGSQAHGIVAQSIGGSGGSSGTSANLLLSLNGAADNGGNGGQVNVYNSGVISTTGAGARGIMAQSIGGGGGAGGTSVGLFALGGAGSNGGSGGVVTVENRVGGTIHTTGVKADGIMAQSIGGSGGSGSNSFGLLALGGGGSKAGNASAVTVWNLGTITTENDGARGIVAQSIGGGGGDGGSTGGLVSVGGTGSGGGDSGVVTVIQGGTITTRGKDAQGILAQSIGGGGGNGGSSGSIGLMAGVSVGGDGGKGGKGGNVDITLQGISSSQASLIGTTGDRSQGIYAQSVGGGGGNGGGAVTVTAGFDAAASFAVGGQGGSAGDGGIVTLGRGTGGSSNVTTFGDNSTAVFLQSVGGGGGSGGFAVAVALSSGFTSGSLSVAIGGNGGGGGKGGDVSAGAFSSGGVLTASGFKGDIFTQGDQSYGFLAQSVGGGGGNGGLAVSVAGSTSLAMSGSLAIGLGGTGAGGGAGGTVKAGVEGTITTIGNNSTALQAQSIGGGGGNGGGSIAVSLTASGGPAGAMGLSIGGNAGPASNGGDVTLATRNSSILTRGDNSKGIVVQSVGGGGGNGGYAVSAGAAGSITDAAAVNVGLGGKGGGGGNGGTVKADLQSDVETSSVMIARAQDPVTGADIPAHYGKNATGVLVQSVGGGGGTGGFSVAAGGALAGTGSGAVSVGLGGSGGTGGTGGSVTVSSTGTILTKGDSSAGLVAQSIGGGGGAGGFSIAVAGAGASAGSGGITVGLGGSGGPGNYAQDVTVNTSIGKITTYGKDSHGVVAQSVGGGGGTGGYDVSVAGAGAGGGSGAISVGLGGSGGAGSYSGTVRLTVNNDVSTYGKNSSGVVAQSIGGGGGTGGYNVSASGAGSMSGSGAISVGLGGSGGSGSNGGEVYATVTGKVETLLENSYGVLAQSIGGGGGNGGYNVSVAGAGGTGAGAVSVGLGGNGSGGGNGLKVELTSSGTIHTVGKGSAGLMAQSIGGGGGSGGFNVNVALAATASGSGAISVGLGGSGAGGGDGGAVTLRSTGNVLTEGNGSIGIGAQSIGGGGGSGGFDVSVPVAIGNGAGAIGVGLGGSGGGGGNATGTVDLKVTNNVTTKGKKSIAVLAQSIGGGGGNGGFDITAPIAAGGTGAGALGISIGGSAAAGGNAGIVISDVTGIITTEKDGSLGILAQSLGGGGGSGGMAISGAVSLAGTGSGAVSIGLGGSGGVGGNAANVTNTLTGSAYTVGKDSSGVVAQSIGGGGGSGGISISGAIAMAKDGAGALAFGLGGSGGTGGDAGALVTNTVVGYVQTQGDNSYGVLSQSMGGGGGSGGLNVSGTITAAKTGSGGLAIGIGGLGGDGGDGKDVISNVTGGVITSGKGSVAIAAQSLGGGGGAGGLNVTGSINVTKENGGTLGVGVGGFGGAGGNAGTVTSTVVATSAYDNLIGTIGDNSTAILAQSVGGGGGAGGMNITGGLNITGKSGASIGVGLGGFGGVAGNGGVVTVNATGNIITQGNQSHGIEAQSIGGAGGDGGINVTGTMAFAQSPATTAAVSVGVGGFGGNGGSSEAVTVNYNGTLTARPMVVLPPVGGHPAQAVYVDGEGSNGIMAQSIGGGGGNGGMNVSGGISYVGGTGHGYGIVVGVGGYGGNGGNAGTATVNVTGGDSITGYGTGHSAILAQSIGGGGGTGAMNVSGGITSDSGLLFGVGGSAGAGGIAKTVTVNATTNVYTSTINNDDDTSSAGVLAQSIGGGGGNGGLNVTGGLAIAKQNSVPSVNFGIGGSGGAGASSGDVNVTLIGDAITSGNWVHGIMAQSIAGGGGNGAMNVGGQLNFASSESSGGNTDLSIIAGIGGTAGDGAVAGNVTIINTGTVTTAGDNARGVAAQSIGGGGGTGGMNVTGIYAKNSNPITVGVGGTGGSGGEAGNATVLRGTATLAAGKVTTDGVNAYGIEASSIGGGGGDAGMNFNVGYSTIGEASSKPGFAAVFTIGGGGGTAASGHSATVVNYSAVETKKDYAYGILAQSIGGGGGNANFNIGVTHAGASTSADSNLYNKPNQNMALSVAVGGATGDGGNGGDVAVTQVGNIITVGKQAIGILAQSIGGGGGNAGLDVGFVKADGGKMGITIGREGGTGGYGGTVTLNYTGTLSTTGEMAFGLLAQSIGNGGGNSSSTTISGEVPTDQNDLGQTRPQSAAIAIGLAGGQGGYGGAVILNSNGKITTTGRRAYGAFAQSVGGGGGNGGKANTAGITAPVIAMSLGGTGGSGSYGGQVDLTNTSIVETFGEEAAGLLAQSIGGGGGNGGSTYSGGTKTGDTGITMGIGGVGGPGMDGGIVNVINDGIIVTHNLAAHGILAQSIGGGGGDGGSAISILRAMHPTTTNASNTTRVAVNVGGNGGTGGDGKAVTVTNRGGIGTYEAASVGIFAQSIGGGGGNGNSVLSAALAGTSGNNVGINIGGNGGTGGTGGNVTVNNLITADPNSGKIITLGDKAYGILAMSVGGGGGTGSNVASISRGTGSGDGGTTVSQVQFSIGGNGGQGGSAGVVEVTNQGSISTQGAGAHGIVAQSVGGGGGNGGMAISGDLAFGSSIPSSNKTFNVAIGGQGDQGGTGGAVTVNNSGSIHVLGKGAYGIYAQSIGGGGGDGGFALAFSRNLKTNPKATLAGANSTFALGGFGGTGGDSGAVTVNHSGSIIAEGDNAFGIYAQSVSGGGGNSALSISSPVWMAANLALETLLGGGSTGTAGKVTINTSGSISMTGNNSVAFFSQSVNGGGGNVNQFMDFSQQAQGLGDNGLPLPGNAGDIDTAYAYLDSVVKVGSDAIFGAVGAAVEATHLGSIYSHGDNNGGGLLQSIGGGGGRGSQNVTLATDSDINLVVKLGGKDVNSSSGGNVTFNQTGGVDAQGTQSAGVTVQTIGGGGGVQFITLKKVPTVTPMLVSPPPASLMALPPPPPPLTATSLTLGGNGGLNNDGGTINTTFSGAPVTSSGDRSPGLIMQSIGAGGGLTYTTLAGASGLNVDIGGQNGASGNGGDITIINTRDVGTNGILSHGILLQSIGGGGGAVFTDLDPSLIAVTLNTDNTGNGGLIDLTQNGNVVVQGDRSTGIILQSLAGGGGLVDDLFAGAAGGTGNSGPVTLVMNGSISATGAGGSGIFAQSKGSGTQGNITVTLTTAKSILFGDGGIGVKFSGGATNLFTNNGSVYGTQGVNGQAFVGEEGDDTFQNNGAFVGSADFGSGANRFNNAAGALLVLGPQFLLGASNNLLINDSVLVPGGSGLAQHTNMTGSFIQSSTGTTFNELDFGTDKLDNISMTGTAKLGGRIDVALLNPQLVPIGHFEKVLVHADGGVTDDGAALTTAPSVVITYDLQYPATGQDAVLSYDINFNPPGGGLGRNLLEVGGYFNNIQNAGSSPLLAPTIIALLYAPDMTTYRELLSQLGPDFYGEQQAEMLRGTQRFGETMLNGGSTRYSLKERTIWFDFLGSNTLHGAYDDYKTVRQQTLGFALGYEDMINEHWSAGLAVSYEDNNANGYQGRWNANGSTERFGGLVRYKNNGHEIAALVSFGWNSMDSTRVGSVAYPFNTSVNRDMQVLTAMVRYAHEFVGDTFYIKPQVDLGVTQLSASAARERGGATTPQAPGVVEATNLALLGYNEAHAWVRPAVTVRKAIIVTNTTRISLHTEMGYQYYINGNDTYVKAGFVGAPIGVDPMNVPIGLGSMASLSVGLQVLIMNDLSFGLYYTKALAKHYHMDLYNFRFNKSF